MNRRYLYFLSLLLFVMSCKGSKTVIGNNKADASLSVRNIITAHQAAEPTFNTLASRVKVAYQDEKNSQSITVSLRVEKDRKIWVKASVLGITLAKALITPNNVSYYETLGKTYFDGDFALLSDWLGTDLDFEKTQAILLGQSIVALNKNYSSSISTNKYRLEPKVQPEDFIHFLLFNPKNFKVSSTKITQPRANRSMSITYGPYQQLSGNIFPSQFSIIATEGNSKTLIDVTYRSIDINAKVSFPFSLPTDYKKIELKK